MTGFQIGLDVKSLILSVIKYNLFHLVHFICDELMTDNNYLLTCTGGELNTTNCSYCKTGKLVIRQYSATGEQFLGCSHYPACNQTFSNIEILEQNYLCPSCKSGFMTKKTSKYWNFLGCTNFPVCRKTINLEEKSAR